MVVILLENPYYPILDILFSISFTRFFFFLFLLPGNFPVWARLNASSSFNVEEKLFGHLHFLLLTFPRALLRFMYFLFRLYLYSISQYRPVFRFNLSIACFQPENVHFFTLKFNFRSAHIFLNTPSVIIFTDEITNISNKTYFFRDRLCSFVFEME